MTVAELIEKLKAMPQDLKVQYPTCSDCVRGSYGDEISLVELDEDGYVQVY